MVVMQEYGVGNQPAPRAPAHVAALLKMRCETSGSSYAMFWQRSTRGGMSTNDMVVGGGYVTPERKAALVAQGLSDTYADACSDVVLDVAGNNFVAKALRSNEAIYIEDVAGCEGFARKDKAARYGIRSICFVAAAGGVIEYGTGNAFWDASGRNALMPASELVAAVTSGCSYAVFWKQQGGEYVVAGDFVLPERVAALKAGRGDDKTFASETRKMRLSAVGDNMVASAACSGKEVVLDKPAESGSFKRASLAKEFNVASIHCVPCAGGVLVLLL